MKRTLGRGAAFAWRLSRNGSIAMPCLARKLRSLGESSLQIRDCARHLRQETRWVIELFLSEGTNLSRFQNARNSEMKSPYLAKWLTGDFDLKPRSGKGLFKIFFGSSFRARRKGALSSRRRAARLVDEPVFMDGHAAFPAVTSQHEGQNWRLPSKIARTRRCFAADAQAATPAQ